MRRIVICDDEDAIRSQLYAYLKELEPQFGERFEITVFSSGEDLLAHFPENVDLVFLDIQMSGISGLDAAKTLRNRGMDFCLIFITSYVQFALEGYSVHAFGFLSKPLQFGLVLQEVEDALKTLSSHRSLTLTLQCGTQVHRVSSDSIHYIDAMGHSITIHQSDHNRSFVYSTDLTSLEEQLKDYGFFRCHKSYLVHFRYIRQILPTSVRMENGDEVPISKYRRRDFLAALARYEEVSM